MKNTMRFAALAAVLGLTSWFSIGQQAHALPQYALCRSVHGTSCTTPGSYKFCTWDRTEGIHSTCYCQGTPLTWQCAEV